MASASAGSADGVAGVPEDSLIVESSAGSGEEMAPAGVHAGIGAYRADKFISAAAITEGLSRRGAQDSLHALVARVYKTASGRDPHPDEVLRAADYAMGISFEYATYLGYGLWDVAHSIFLSEDGSMAGKCLDESTISKIYTAILGRDASSDEKDYWLTSPAGVSSLIYALIVSGEFVNSNATFRGLAYPDQYRSGLCSAFIALLDRLPAPGELDYWGYYPIVDVIEALLASKEYRDRALSEEETALRIILLEEDAYLHTKR